MINGDQTEGANDTNLVSITLNGAEASNTKQETAVIVGGTATTPSPHSGSPVIASPTPQPVVNVAVKNTTTTTNQPKHPNSNNSNNNRNIGGHVSPPSSLSGRKLPRFQAVVRRIGSTIATTIGSAGGQPKRQRKREKDFLKAYLKKFDADEVEVLRKVYKELSSRSPGSGIDKETFLQYFPLPGLWGERLFQRFDYKCLGLVDYEEFLVGIAVCCRGTKCERIHVLFQVFDLNGDGVLQRQELVAMLSNLPNLDRYLQKGNTTTTMMEKEGGRESADQGAADGQKGNRILHRHRSGGTISGDSTLTRSYMEGLDVTEQQRQDSVTDAITANGKQRGSIVVDHNVVVTHHQGTTVLNRGMEHACCSVVMQLSNMQTSLEAQSGAHQQGSCVPARENVTVHPGASSVAVESGGSGGDGVDEESFRSMGGYRAESDFDEDDDIDDDDDDDEDDEEDMLDDDYDDDDDLDGDNEELSDEEIEDDNSVDHDDEMSRHHHDSEYRSGREEDESELDRYLVDWPPQEIRGDEKATMPRITLTEQQSSTAAGATSSILNPTTAAGAESCHQHHTGSGLSTPIGSRRRESAMSSTGSTTTHDDLSGNGVESTIQSLRQRNNNAIDVEAFVDKIIEECEFSDCDSLTFIEFKTWLEKNDAILNMFTDCLHEEAWGLQGNALYRRIGDQGERTGRRQRRFNIIHRGQGNDDGSKRGVVEIRPDGFYKVKRLFTLPTNGGIAAMLAAQQPFRQQEPGPPAVSALPPRLSTAGPSLTRTSSAPPSPRQTITTEPDQNHHHDDHDKECAKVLPPTTEGQTTSITATTTAPNELQVPPPSEPVAASGVCLGGSTAMDLEIYPRQTREVLNHQLIDLILASNPDVDINALEAGRSVIPSQEEILACPACRSLLVVCPRCHRRCPNIRLKNGSVVIECRGCLEGTPYEFYNCWHCHWSFAEAPEWVDQCEPLHEGRLYKIGKHTHKWRSRYFVLVDNLLYYYGRKEDTKPKGFFFLEGCFVEPISSGSSKSSSVDGGHPTLSSGIEMEGCSRVSTSTTAPSSGAPSSLIKISVPSTSSSGNKFGFSIAHGGGKVPRRDLYASTEEEREAWMKALRTAMNQQSIEEAYGLGSVVGQGKFSIVYNAWAKDTNQEVAIKVIDKSKISGHEKELLRSEIAILRLLRHPHVISLREVLDSQKSIYIIMEYVKGGELYDLLQQKRRLPELHVNRIIFQLLTTVAYLHKCGIIHRDLKPENILLTDKTTDADIKITDFGLSCICGMDELVTQPCGTLAYVAPEVLTLKGYNHKVDVWSVGVIMYLLLRGRLPFPVGRVAGIAKSSTMYRQLTFEGPIWDNVCSSAKDLLRKLLQPSPDKRISAQEALQHLWIKNPTAVISEGLPDDADQNAPQPHLGNDTKEVHLTDVTPRMRDNAIARGGFSVQGVNGPPGVIHALPSTDGQRSNNDLSPQLLDVSASTFSVPIAPTVIATTSPTPMTVVSHIDGAQIPTTGTITISSVITSPLPIPQSSTSNHPPSSTSNTTGPSSSSSSSSSAND